jgi:hypothetical protein
MYSCLPLCAHLSRAVLQSSPATKGWSLASCIIRYRADARCWYCVRLGVCLQAPALQQQKAATRSSSNAVQRQRQQQTHRQQHRSAVKALSGPYAVEALLGPRAALLLRSAFYLAAAHEPSSLRRSDRILGVRSNTYPGPKN